MKILQIFLWMIQKIMIYNTKKHMNYSQFAPDSHLFDIELLSS